MKGIRGAITINENTAEEIREKTILLLKEIIKKNNLSLDEIVSGIFTVTKDINAGFPPAAARSIGWENIPMISATEIDVPGSLPLCIRVLLHINRHGSAKVFHVYLEGASILRPDLLEADK